MSSKLSMLLPVTTQTGKKIFILKLKIAATHIFLLK